jgi:hypothetical protein
VPAKPRAPLEHAFAREPEHQQHEQDHREHRDEQHEREHDVDEALGDEGHAGTRTREPLSGLFDVG